MENLENFFKVPFDDVKITDDRIGAFTIDHLAKLQANNGSHDYDSMITNTQGTYTTFQATKVSKTDTKMVRKSKTITVEEYEKQYVALVRQAEATVLSKYIKSSPVYSEFFTNHLTDYTRAPRAEISENIDHFITCFTAHTEFVPYMLTALVALKTSFVPARANQESEAGTVKTLIQETSVERKVLNQQLQLNVIALAIKFIGQPEYVKVFFDTSLLFYHEHIVVTPGVVHPVKIKPLLIKESGIIGLEGMSIRVINTETSSVQLWAASTKQTPAPNANAVTLAKGGDAIYQMAKLGTKPTDKYLFIKNLDVTTAEITVEIVSQPVIPPIISPA